MAESFAHDVKQEERILNPDHFRLIFPSATKKKARYVRCISECVTRTTTRTFVQSNGQYGQVILQISYRLFIRLKNTACTDLLNALSGVRFRSRNWKRLFSKQTHV